MDKISTLLAALDAYSQQHGKSPQSIVRAATGNPRLYDRLIERRNRLDKDCDKIAKHIGFNLSGSIGTDVCAERHGRKGGAEKNGAAA